ncbi:TlyA family RNA methyltransferase [Ruania alkalisoli]|uniref:TlyA family RNA methyltransferase n=1 Tax=Ruania alkalisoli TaxID=2779775 RepID=A0A7M1SXC8_9MICO|nr:TlyA family RNA methyltransferase [Ruania alkalisoli]QOR72219.1 TlyA family RNA methyltransferase [Ruania alkalisoli]
MARRARLDAELVRRGLARSRQHAAELIAEGRVLLDGTRANKAATQLDPARAVRVLEPADGAKEYASRGGHKLAGALDALGSKAPRVAGRHALDAGASTGGFTDVLLRRGARSVVAVDVGYGQLVWALRNDDRVLVMDRTNVRSLRPEDVQPPVDLVVGDLSFISLTLVLPALWSVATPEADLLLMVKPQFEVGKERLGSGGVVRDTALHADAVHTVVAAAAELGLGLRAAVASPLPGPSGNVEYFVHLHAGPGTDPESMIAHAIATGPAGAAAATGETS